jgi:hypothetical protein
MRPASATSCGGNTDWAERGSIARTRRRFCARLYLFGRAARDRRSNGRADLIAGGRPPASGDRYKTGNQFNRPLRST